MIKCHLSRLMGEHKMRVKDVADATGLHRNTITLLYKETAERVDLATMDALCRLFSCTVSELFEYVANPGKPAAGKSSKSRRTRRS